MKCKHIPIGKKMMGRLFSGWTQGRLVCESVSAVKHKRNRFDCTFCESALLSCRASSSCRGFEGQSEVHHVPSLYRLVLGSLSCQFRI